MSRMAKSYDHRAIEKKWQERWEKQKLFEAPDSVKGKENFYTLFEFPYPSGDLHIGHWYAYSVPDMFARMKRMQGKNVLFPIGFDSFGLPAESAAIKNKIDPMKWTYDNITRMRAQLKTMGNSVDWSREVITSDPAFYRWTQWLFLKLYERGLAYKKKALVNWDPVDKTVLANEQVLPDGTAERSGAVVEKKELEQWFFKITDYADRLIDDLEPLQWPEPIKDAQRNWIGRSEGAEIDFPLVGDTIKRFVVLHGKGATPKSGFHPWLLRTLREKGYEVVIPNLPNSDNPHDDEQADFVEKNCALDNETAIVGHSFGGIVALRLLERGHHIHSVVLVGTPYSGTYLDRKERPTVTRAVGKGFDAKRILKNVESMTLLYDTHDKIVPPSDGDALQALLGGTLIKREAAKSHFTSTVEREVLAACVPNVRIFTTRPDTLYGATYLVLAPEHALITELVQNRNLLVKNIKEVDAYVRASKRKSELDRQKQEKDKTGVRVLGVMAVNPATKEQIPVYVADYVLGHYGTGAVMAVPAHDERDFEFAQKFSLPIRPVVLSGGSVQSGWTLEKYADEWNDHYKNPGKLYDSGAFTGHDSEEAKREITESVSGKITTTYKLRDWLVSRQRYWGAPIPIVYDPEGNAHAVPEKHLPWMLPTDVDHTPTGVAPLARSKELHARTEKIFGKGWRPDSDTLDTFVDSSWYFLRYLDSHNTEEFSSLARQKKWMPIDRYSGGSEHTTVHVLYSRFLYKALYDATLVTHEEPYTVRQNRGLILAEDGRKMSKRWGNVVNPDEQVSNVGADAVRTYLGFIGPYNVVGSFPWSTNGLIGVRKFLERVYGMKDEVGDVPLSHEVSLLMNQTIKKVGEDLETMKINTSISQLMIFSNALQGLNVVPRGGYETLIRLLAPCAPHLAEEIWESLGHATSVHLEKWPSFNPTELKSNVVTIAVMQNGKTKGTVEAARGATQDEVEKLVKIDKRLSVIAAKSVTRIVFVEDRVINYVG